MATSLSERLTAWRPRTDLAVGTCAAIAIFVVLLIRNPWILRSPVVFGGDEGVQMGTAWDAITFRELRGAGSRTGFHHPGQGYSYIWGLADLVRHVLRIPFGRHNIEMLATEGFVAAQLGAIVAIARSHLGTFVHGLLVVGGLVLLAWPEPGIFVGPWLPYMYVGSFALLVVAGASSVAGRLSSLPAYAVAAGFLIHGHIQFVSFVVVGTLVLVIGLWRTGGLRSLWDEHRSSLWWTLGILGLFALPIVVYTLQDWPGELDDYLNYMRSSKTGGHSLTEGVRFTMQYWPGSTTLVRLSVAGLAAAGLLATSLWRRSRFGVCLLAGSIVVELCMLYYSMRGVDDLAARYVGLFTFTIPGLMIGTAVALLLPAEAPASTARRLTMAGLVVGVLALGLTSRALQYTPVRFDESATAAVDHMERVADGRVIAIDTPYGVLGSFYLVPALISLAEDDGDRICLVDRSWVIKYGAERTCTRDQLADAARFTVYPAETPLPPGVAERNPTLYQTAYVLDGAGPRA